MEDNVQNQLKNYIEPQSLNHQSDFERAKTQDIASVAMTVYAFMDYMFDEIEHAGYSSHEFTSKSELFLKAVTPTYPIESFKDILLTFNKIDSRFPQTKFYRGFQGLRALCSGDHNAVIELIDDEGRAKLIDKRVVNKSLVFFGTFLVEKIIRFIKEYKAQNNLREISVKDVRKKIDDHFDHIVVQTVSHL